MEADWRQKGSEGVGWVESLGVLRFAQDDSKNKRDKSKENETEKQRGEGEAIKIERQKREA
jgi:hypothetical protein